MRVVIVTGIFPPDIGGPATHAADLRTELTERGHRVTVVTLCDDGAPAAPDGVVRYPRRWPWPARMLAVTTWLLRNRRHYEVVYATGLEQAAVLGAELARRPVVVKIVGDLAWERGSRLGLTDEGFERFQDGASRSPRLRAMRLVRDATIRRAGAVVTPSAHLGAVVQQWAGRGDGVVTIPNGVRTAGPAAAPERAPRDGLHLVFVGRLVALKRVEVLLEAVARTPQATLDVLGDGPERAGLEGRARRLGLSDRVTFPGPLAHDQVMDRLAGADALAMASTHEGLPHAVIEALACGTPVIATAAGGTGEVVTHGLDGLLVEPPTTDGYVATFTRLVEEQSLLPHLCRHAAQTGAGWRFDRCADQVEELLVNLVSSRPASSASRPRTKPRAVFVGKTRIGSPPGEDLEKKFAIHSELLDMVLVSIGPRRTQRISGVRALAVPALKPAFLGGLLFYAVGPVMAVGLAAGRKRCAIVCQSPFEAFGVVLLLRLLPRRLRPRVQVELHGDWSTAPRMYGSRLRSVVGPVSDRVAEWSLRRADHVRVVSEVLEVMARRAGYKGPIDRYITFSDYSTFLDHPPVAPPEEPTAAFVGVLERYKAVDVLLEAWPEVLARVPGARLVMVGAGSMGDEVRGRIRERGLAASITLMEPMARPRLRELLDRSNCLVLPSRSEGLARIVMEAMARARPVVASMVGGIAEVVEDGVNGRLVPADDVLALADALADVLSDLDGARAMGEEARRRAESRAPLAEYEGGIARLASWIDEG